MKILALTDSGNNKTIVDVDSKITTSIKFTSLGDLRYYESTDEIIAVDHKGRVAEVKSGDRLIKSWCGEVLIGITKDMSAFELLDLLLKQREENNLKKKISSLDDTEVPYETEPADCCNSSN